MRLMHKFKIQAKPTKPLSTACSLARSLSTNVIDCIYYNMIMCFNDDYL